MSHLIDQLAYTNRLSRLPAQHKLGFGIALLVLALVTVWPIQLVIGCWVLVVVVGYARIPAGLYLKLLALPLGFTLLSLPALVVNVADLSQVPGLQADVWLGGLMPVGNWRVYLSQAGIRQVWQVLPRVWATTHCLYFMVLTIPFMEILQVLQQLRCPILLLELLQLMYRFIFMLLAVAADIWTAQQARCGYRTYARSFASLGILVGQLLQRTLVSYRQISLSLAVRGNFAPLQVWVPQPYRPSRRYSCEAMMGLASLTIWAWAWR